MAAYLTIALRHFFFFFSSRRRHTRSTRDWSSDVCSSDLPTNWQQPDWPSFRWERARLEAAEKQFLVGGGMFVGTVRHLGNEEREQLTIEAMRDRKSVV